MFKRLHLLSLAGYWGVVVAAVVSAPAYADSYTVTVTPEQPFVDWTVTFVEGDTLDVTVSTGVDCPLDFAVTADPYLQLLDESGNVDYADDDGGHNDVGNCFTSRLVVAEPVGTFTLRFNTYQTVVMGEAVPETTWTVTFAEESWTPTPPTTTTSTTTSSTSTTTTTTSTSTTSTSTTTTTLAPTTTTTTVAPTTTTSTTSTTTTTTTTTTVALTTTTTTVAPTTTSTSTTTTSSTTTSTTSTTTSTTTVPATTTTVAPTTSTTIAVVPTTNPPTETSKPPAPPADAPVEVREEFEETQNIFDGSYDEYVPLGSTVDVATRRTVTTASVVIGVVPTFTPLQIARKRR